MKTRKIWSPEELALLYELYPDNSAGYVAKIIGCNLVQVYRKATALKIGKSDEYKKMYSEKRNKKLIEVAKKNQFKTGHIPANKGKKLTPEAYQNAAPTMFKPGMKPHTYLEGLGHLRVRQKGGKSKSSECYVYIKVADSRWALFHRWLWEKYHGQIPKTHVVFFKDGNNLNCTIANLGIRTRKEHLAITSGRANLEDKYLARMILGPGKKNEHEKIAAIMEAKPLLRLKKAELLTKQFLKK